MRKERCLDVMTSNFTFPTAKDKMRKRKHDRRHGNYRFLRFCLGSVVVFFIVFIATDAWIENASQGKLFNSTADIPKKKVGLILGTSKYSKQGQNLFYSGRIKAAVALYEAGKIEYILSSGDNGTKYYNEPKTFREDLIKMGIPKNRIVLDYAGFRTLDSVVRAKEVFQENEFTIISQQFHNERALFITKFKGMEAIGFNARNVGGERGMNVKIRERLARINMLLDLLIGTQPKFLGDKIVIG